MKTIKKPEARFYSFMCGAASVILENLIKELESRQSLTKIPDLWTEYVIKRARLWLEALEKGEVEW